MHRNMGYEEGKGLPVLIVDDHPMVRDGIRSLLAGHADIQIVGEASNGIEAILLVEKLHPSIVLMDMSMPRMNGIAATARTTRGYGVPAASILAASNYCSAMAAFGSSVIRLPFQPGALYQRATAVKPLATSDRSPANRGAGKIGACVTASARC